MNPWEYARRYAEKPTRHIIGLMSGTSVDAVDAALVRVSGSGRDTMAELLHFVTHPFPDELRQCVLDVSHGKGNTEEVSRLNVAMGGLFADAADAVLTASGLPRETLDAVASHGQTVSHTPHHNATLQIGEASYIAQRLGVPVVSDFRAADMTAGGQGAPLVPYADWCLLTHPTKSRAIQNIGGIGNVTYLPANAMPTQVLGFDTGPGNMLMDRGAAWATFGTRNFDDGGKMASAGKVLPDVLEWLLDHPFLMRKPPKSAGREEFGDGFFDSLLARHSLSRERANYVMATLTAFTAYSIADAYDRFFPALPDEIIVGGGGSRNQTLLVMLAEKLPGIPIRTHEDVGINGDAKEAIAFAVLANETMLGNPSNLPSVTGAQRPVVLGKITLP